MSNFIQINTGRKIYSKVCVNVDDISHIMDYSGQHKDYSCQIFLKSRKSEDDALLTEDTYDELCNMILKFQHFTQFNQQFDMFVKKD